MFSILFLFEASIIAETLVFLRQLSIVYSFFLQLKHFSSFISYDISTSKFLGIKVIDAWNVLDGSKKDVFLLNIAGAWKENIIALTKTLAVVYIIVEDLAFFLI